jgi:4-cresol dehydrogenase (hydroxylating)
MTTFALPESVRDRLIAVVGVDAALVTDEERDDYRDPYWFQADRTYDSSLVLFPQSTEQVQEIVRIADEHRVPLWASSQGRNNGYGGPSARVRGSVLLSFRRMNRVLEIDSELAFAVVEPGVRWVDLYDELQATGNDDLLLSVPDIGWGSIIGNSLDNGMTYLPLGSDHQAPCGMEVVLADGTLLRTGMGAIPGNRSWHLTKRGLGPTLDPLFTQSNLGIVTRMGVWLMRRPKAYAPLYCSVPRDHQLAQAIDIVRGLRQEGIIRGVPSFLNLITMGAQFPDAMELGARRDSTWSEDRLDALADDTGIGRWGFRVGLYGDPDVVDIHIRRVREAWSAIEGSRVDHAQTYTPETWHEIEPFIDRVLAGVPSFDLVDRMPEGQGHIGFSPVVPLIGSEVEKVANIIKRHVIARVGTNFVCAIYPTNDRSAIIVSSLTFDTRDEAQTTASFAAAKELIAELGALGYGEYRAHIDIQDLASDQYSYGDHAYRRFVERIKDAVDPNGILSPGRYGIWPAGSRS